MLFLPLFSFLGDNRSHSYQQVLGKCRWQVLVLKGKYSPTSQVSRERHSGAWKPFLHPFNVHIYMCRYTHLLMLCFSHPPPLFLMFHIYDNFYLFLKPVFCRSSKPCFLSRGHQKASLNILPYASPTPAHGPVTQLSRAWGHFSLPKRCCGESCPILCYS